MSTADSLIVCSNNPKKNSPIIGRKDKTNNLKINVIINNIAKAKEDDNPNSLDNKGNPKRRDKREERFYDKKNDNGSGKIQIVKPNKYHKEREKLESWLFQLLIWFWDHNTPIIKGKCIIYIFNLMCERIFKWIQLLLKEFLNNKKNDEGIFANYKKFQKKIRMIFGTINDKEYAIKIIKTFR